ncbi:MAG TPA: 50S ribosomal protein L13 [Desulfotomaculum sp.]|nr:50S ribosomal protein L13 [Desulfotomaculum sp.]
MKTYMAKKEEMKEKWYLIDAEGKVLGRMAAEAASLLRGKHSPLYTPHISIGSHVIIINAAKVILTGKKLKNKFYIRHSNYPGGLKKINYATLMQNRSGLVVEKAVKGMLPHNRLGAAMAKKLRVYSGAEHPHAAQAPEKWEVGT